MTIETVFHITFVSICLALGFFLGRYGQKGKTKHLTDTEEQLRQHLADAEEQLRRLDHALFLPGFICRKCGVFCGTMKENHTHCRCCGTER